MQLSHATHAVWAADGRHLRASTAALGLCLAAAVGGPVLDAATPRGVADGMLYVALVLPSLWLPWCAAPFVLATAGTALTIGGYFLSAPETEEWIVLSNRGLALAMIWMTALLCHLYRRATRRLHDDAAQLRAVCDTALDAILLIDATGTILRVNPTCTHLFGHEAPALLGRNVSMLMPSPDRERHDGYIRRYMETGVRRLVGSSRNVTVMRRDGTMFPAQLTVGEASLSGKRVFTGFIRDLSERQRAEDGVREMESELYRIARQDELGEMVSAIAHELNQPLAAVRNYVAAAQRLLHQSLNVPDDVGTAMAKAADQACRAAEVLCQLRRFLRTEDRERTADDLSSAVRETADFALIGSRQLGIEVTLDLAPDLPPCLMNRIQVQQVLFHLLRNSMEALRTSTRRELAIRTATAGEDRVEVEVADSGPGLARQVEERLFMPFVTTKPHGTGIGLCVAHSIVEAHGGRIWAEPRSGGGTVFRFTLPAMPYRNAQASSPPGK